ncbi:MAG: hypothetical protein AAGF57_06515 [Pseudomonadota bacterium]
MKNVGYLLPIFLTLSAGATAPIVSASEQFTTKCVQPANNTTPYGPNYFNCLNKVTINRGQKYATINVQCQTNTGKMVKPMGPPDCTTDYGYPKQESNGNYFCYMVWGDNPPKASKTAQVPVYFQCCAVPGTCNP